MKADAVTKTLLGTTALVSLGLAVATAEVQASERIRLMLGGYMEQWVGFSNQDVLPDQDYSGIHMVSDAEIHFRGAFTFAGGSTVGAVVQLEGQSDSDQIDESYLFLKGAFGELVVGSENTAMYKMHYAPDEYGIGISSGDQSLWVIPLRDTSGVAITSTEKSFRRPYNSVHLEPMGIDDEFSVSYYSPRVMGVQFGVSWVPEAHSDSGETFADRTEDPTDLVSAGVNFINTVGPVGIKASVGYGTVLSVMDGAEKPTALNAGFGLVYRGYSIGGSYAEADKSGAHNGKSWLVGVSYEGGPWGVSVNYFKGEREGISTTTGAGTIDAPFVTRLTSQAEQETVMLSAKYMAGPGISFAGTLGHTKFTSEDTALVGLSVATVEGAYIVVGPRISF